MRGYIYSHDLYHHGIKGQRWGVRRYENYDGTLTNAGKLRYNKGGAKSNGGVKIPETSKSRLTDSQKKAIAVGATAAVAALAVYGAYKTGYLTNPGYVSPSYSMNSFSSNTDNAFDAFNFSNLRDSVPSSADTTRGKEAVKSAVRAASSNASSEAVNRGQEAVKSAMKSVGGDRVSSEAVNVGTKAAEKAAEKASESLRYGIKKMSKPESLADSLKSANPLRGTKDGKNNCTFSSVAGALRMMGYDVTARSTGGVGQDAGGIMESCFKHVKVHDGSAIKFGKSPADAKELLLKRADVSDLKPGQTAFGFCGIQWAGANFGHCFSWQIKDGKVTFLDFQQNCQGEALEKSYWPDIDLKGNLAFGRLDNLEINWEEVSKVVQPR